MADFGGYADGRRVSGGLSTPKSPSGSFGTAPVRCSHRPNSTIAVPRRSSCRYQQLGHEVPMHLFVTEGSETYLEVDQLGWDKFIKER